MLKADASVEHELPYRVERPEVGDDSAVGASLLAAQTRDRERVLPDRAGLGRHHLYARQVLAIDLQQPKPGAVILADDLRFELIAVW
jgi:hypothetical protein